jgi:inner membrane protein
LEPVTHILFGACMGRAGLNRNTGLATATLALAAEISDIDFVYAFRGPVSALQHHRGWTHSIVSMPVMAALAVLVVWGWNRRFRPHRLRGDTPGRLPVRWRTLYLIALLGPLSHILLDYTTAYGIRLFEPFSYRWYEWDTVFIVEPFMLAVMVLGLAMPSLFGLIQQEIGARQKGPRGRAGAVFALVAVALMWGVRDFEHRRAVGALDSHVYQGQAAFRVSAYPYMWNPFVWHGVIETQDFFQTLTVDSRSGDIDPEDRARIYFKPEETPALAAAKQSYLGRVYLDWAKYTLTITEPGSETGVAWTVRFMDLRYAYPDRSRLPLSATVDLDRNLDVLAQRFGRREQK